MKQKLENRNQDSEHISELKNKEKNTSGITLIALIITIIVMLILVAVTVNVVVNSGLFKHASDAGEGWKQAQEREQNIGAGNVQVGDYGSINEYLENNPITNPELDRRNIKVGDYINYTPDTASTYSLTAAVSGADSEQTISQESLKWRVMNINADGSVELISAMPTTKAVTFKNAIGYNNGVLVLNDICKKQYSNTSLGVTARSLDILDIEKKLNSSGQAKRAAAKSDAGIQYGQTNSYGSGKSYAPDIFDHTGTSAEEESKDYYTTPTSATHTDKGSLTVTQTQYDIDSADCPNWFDDQVFYNLVFGVNANVWLASRDVWCSVDDHVLFGLRRVRYDGSLQGVSMFDSEGNPDGGGMFVRPVVTLGSNIKISTTGGTADSPRTISL